MRLNKRDASALLVKLQTQVIIWWRQGTREPGVRERLIKRKEKPGISDSVYWNAGSFIQLFICKEQLTRFQ